VTARGARWQPLAAITLAVLGGHLLILRAMNFSLQMPDPLAHRTLVTRTIVLAPPEAAEAPAATETVQPAPQPAAIPRSMRAATAPAAPAVAPPAATVPVPEAPAPVAEPAPAAAPAPAEPAPTPPRDATALVALAIPGSVKLQYKVFAVYRGQDRQASGLLHWRHDGVTYDAKLETSIPLFPTITQHSTGRITAEGLAPQRFSDKRRNEQATHFERDKGRIVFSNNRPEAVLMAGAQDQLSVMLQLASLIGGSPAKFRTGNTITVQTASPRDADNWVFTVEGEEQLQLPGGNVAALKLTRNPRKEHDQKVELWLAPGMDYVPVRLRLTNSNGDGVDQQWSGTDRG
jgi:hypothetical protein